MKERFKFKMIRRGKVVAQSHEYDDAGSCIAAARINPLFVSSKTVMILRDSGGTDHPSNAGKFFLHWIIK